MKLVALVAGLALVMLSLLSCKGTGGGGEEVSGKIEVDAYQFTGHVTNNGKKNTLRLEMYYTDSVIGILGRSYLNKGVLRGRLTSDSVNIFFPTEDQYVQEALAELFASDLCAVPLDDLAVDQMFLTLPDSLPVAELLLIDSDYSDRKRASFDIRADGCKWRLHLEYDQTKWGWRLREYDFSDGEEFRLNGSRDRYRSGAHIRASRLEPRPTTDAVRIRP